MAPASSKVSDPKFYHVEVPSKSPIECCSFQSTAGVHYPTLIFTHGAGGDLRSDAMVNFSRGFSKELPIVCFKGNMNLKSRVSMFEAVIEHTKCQTSNCLGGRSMGARAAVMAASEGSTTHLVLASYPLQTEKELRDKILLDIPSSVKVVFVSGDNDSMCDLDRLEEVRSKMTCKSWRIVVENTDHGMNVKPKKATESVGRLAAETVAKWILSSSPDNTEGRISWNERLGQPQWSGWSASAPAHSSGKPGTKKEATLDTMGFVKRKAPASGDTGRSSSSKRRKA